MRGANVVRRRSATNPGETASDTGSVNGGQANGGGSGLLAGGNATGDPGAAGAASRWDAGSTGPQVALGQAAAAQGVQGGSITAQEGYGAPAGQGGQSSADQGGQGVQAPPAALPGAGRPAQARARRPVSSRSRFALTNWRVRWRLVAIIAVPTLTAAALGSLQIYGDVSNWNASGRVQHLAQLNSAVVSLSQALEDERDLSAGYAAAFPTVRTAGRGSQQAVNLAKASTSEPGTSRPPCRTSTR
jgi:hypothetical protein